MQETYYIAPLSESPSQKISKGKLTDKYRNQRKALKQAGVVIVARREIQLVDFAEIQGYTKFMLLTADVNDIPI